MLSIIGWCWYLKIAGRVRKLMWGLQTMTSNIAAVPNIQAIYQKPNSNNNDNKNIFREKITAEK